MYLEEAHLKKALTDTDILLATEVKLQQQASNIFMESIERSSGLEELKTRIKEALDALRRDSA